MFTVTNHNNGYNVKLSEPGTGTRGRVFFARDLEQVHVALDHYHMKHHDNANCILCDDMRVNIEKLKAQR